MSLTSSKEVRDDASAGGRVSEGRVRGEVRARAARGARRGPRLQHRPRGPECYRHRRNEGHRARLRGHARRVGRQRRLLREEQGRSGRGRRGREAAQPERQGLRRRSGHVVAGRKHRGIRRSGGQPPRRRGHLHLERRRPGHRALGQGVRGQLPCRHTRMLGPIQCRPAPLQEEQGALVRGRVFHRGQAGRRTEFLRGHESGPYSLGKGFCGQVRCPRDPIQRAEPGHDNLPGRLVGEQQGPLSPRLCRSPREKPDRPHGHRSGSRPRDLVPGITGGLVYHRDEPDHRRLHYEGRVALDSFFIPMEALQRHRSSQHLCVLGLLGLLERYLAAHQAVALAAQLGGQLGRRFTLARRARLLLLAAFAFDADDLAPGLARIETDLVRLGSDGVLGQVHAVDQLLLLGAECPHAVVGRIVQVGCERCPRRVPLLLVVQRSFLPGDRASGGLLGGLARRGRLGKPFLGRHLLVEELQLDRAALDPLEEGRALAAHLGEERQELRRRQPELGLEVVDRLLLEADADEDRGLERVQRDALVRSGPVVRPRRRAGGGRERPGEVEPRQLRDHVQDDVVV